MNRETITNLWTSSFIYRKIEESISNSFRKRLRNDEFTILCSNCIGGVIYHRLGKQFMSPTINLFFKQTDFISFCVNMEYYLKKELVFIGKKDGFPIAQIYGDGLSIPTVTIFFNHYKDETIAREKWEERKQRIRRDNLFIILYKLDGVTIDQLRMLEQIPCRNKVVFSAIPLPEISWSFYIKPNIRHKYPYSYLSKNIFGVRYFERRFNFVDFLNEGQQSK